MNFIKCWFNGHRYNKPRVRIVNYPPFVKVHKYVTCKDCNKKRRLSPDEQFQTYFYAAKFEPNHNEAKQ